MVFRGACQVARTSGRRGGNNVNSKTGDNSVEFVVMMFESSWWRGECGVI